MQRIQDNSIMVHYELKDSSTHVMDARVEAESSLCYVKAANYISKVIGIDNELNTGALSQGSVVKIFWFKIEADSNSDVLCYILTKIFTRIFYEMKIVRFEDIFEGLEKDDKVRVEEQLKELKVDDNTLERLNSHIHIKKNRTEYFKQLKSCKNISAVGIKHNDFRNLENVDLRIDSSSFDKYIETILPETIVKEDAKVYINSPVIVKDKTIKWHGNYEGEDIRFDMLSNQFKTEAQNGEIDFRTGYYITCRLQYEESFDEDENIIHRSYKVLDVYGHGIDDQYKETASGKKKRFEDNEPSLFDGLEDWQ